MVSSYKAALATLTEEQRQAVVLRVQMGFTYQQVAEAMGSPSMDAARMLVARALSNCRRRWLSAHDEEAPLRLTVRPGPSRRFRRRRRRTGGTGILLPGSIPERVPDG